MELTKPQEQGLRGINIEIARAKAKDNGLQVNEKKDTRHGLDVFINECGLGVEKGKATAALLFPESLAAGERADVTSYKDAMEKAKKIATEKGWTWRDYAKGDYGYEIGTEIVKWFKALQLKEIDVNVRVTDEAKELNKDRKRTDPRTGRVRKGLGSQHISALDLPLLLAKLPAFMAMEASGNFEASIHTFVTPKWHDGQAGIMIDDVIEEKALALLGTPTAIVQTSEHKAQFFYIVDMGERPKDFYHYIMKSVNAMFGDPKVTKLNHDTRLPGFRNMKHGNEIIKGPKVFVRFFMTNAPTQFIEWVDSEYLKWTASQTNQNGFNTVKIKEPASSQTETVKNTVLQSKYHRVRPPEPKDIKNCDYQDFIKDNTAKSVDRTDFKNFVNSIPFVFVPEWIREYGKKIQAAIIADAERAVNEKRQKYIDRSKVDFMTARALRLCGAGLSEIASFLLEYGLQDDTPVQRPYGAHQEGAMHETVRLPDDKTRERASRRVAANVTFDHPQSWASQHPDQEEKSCYVLVAKYRAIIEAMYAEKARQSHNNVEQDIDL